MRCSRYREEQIIGILKEHQADLSAQELCRKHGISDATFYKWRSKYGGLEVSDARKLKALEEENRQLKKLLAESMLDASTLKEMLRKKLLTPRLRRLAVNWAIKDKSYSQRRACALVRLQLALERRRFPYSRRPPIRVDRGLRWLPGVEPEARAERSDNLDGPLCEWNGTGNWRPTMAQRRRTERSLRRRIPRR
jgi:putative transposase